MHLTRDDACAPRPAARKPRVAAPLFAAAEGLPKIVHQTFHTRALPVELGEAMGAIQRGNPDWEHRFYDDVTARDFIADSYGPAILAYYDAINPKYRAARADLFRYLVVYRSGGVYLDIKSLPTRPLSEVIRPDDRYLISQWRNGPGEAFCDWGLHAELARVPGGEFQQWYIAASPGHPFLRAVIERVLRNLRTYNPGLHGVGQLGVLRVTGPIAYTLAIHPLLARHPHRRVDAHRDLAFEYSIYGKEGHKGALGVHYSELDEPLTPVGAVTQATARVIGSLKRLRRAALRRDQAAAPSPARGPA